VLLSAESIVIANVCPARASHPPIGQTIADISFTCRVVRARRELDPSLVDRRRGVMTTGRERR
jgi:hypothetical protein